MGWHFGGRNDGLKIQISKWGVDVVKKVGSKTQEGDKERREKEKKRRSEEV
jgi:hypothetical protein